MTLRSWALCVLLSCLCILGGCSRKKPDNADICLYTRQILQNEYPAQMNLLRAGSNASIQGEISFIGNEGLLEKYYELYLNYDVRDNVDGRTESDGLPDFAGESFSFVPVLAEQSQDSLSLMRQRETLVKVSLALLDTVYHVSPYDLDGLGRRAASKALVLCDPSFLKDGYQDIDTLLNASSSAVMLFSPLALSLDQAFGRLGRKEINAGIIVDSTVCALDSYAQVFAHYTASRGATASKCYTLPSDASDSLMHHLVASYASVSTKPLDCIIVDDLSIDVPRLKNELADMLSVLNESSMTYGKMLSDDFVLIVSSEVLARRLYDSLRSRNLFTHNISRPSGIYYTASAPLEGSGPSLIMISGNYVQN